MSQNISNKNTCFIQLYLTQSTFDKNPRAQDSTLRRCNIYFPSSGSLHFWDWSYMYVLQGSLRKACLLVVFRWRGNRSPVNFNPSRVFLSHPLSVLSAFSPSLFLTLCTAVTLESLSSLGEHMLSFLRRHQASPFFLEQPSHTPSLLLLSSSYGYKGLKD